MLIMRSMKKHQNGFGLLGTVVIVAALLILGSLGWVAWHQSQSKSTAKNASSQPTTSQSKTNVTPKATQLHTPQEAVSLTQRTYDTYLAAVNAGNEYNTNHPSATNKTLPRYGLDAIKSDLTPDLYSKILSDEQTKGGDEAGCALYQVDRYTASLGSSNSESAVINVGVDGGQHGSISAKVDLVNLKITSITCHTH